MNKPYRISQHGVSQSCLINTVYHISIGHLGIPKTLRFKMRLVHNLSCENEFYLPENEISFPYQRLSTYPRFETEARGELRNDLLGFEESGRRARGFFNNFPPLERRGREFNRGFTGNHSVNFRISEFSLFTTSLTAKSLYFNAKKTIFP